VVLIEPRETLTVQQIRFVNKLFSQKKRKLGVALRRLGIGEEGVAPELLSRRVWDLSAREIGAALGAIERQSLQII
jgi:hypothetical protein